MTLPTRFLLPALLAAWTSTAGAQVALDTSGTAQGEAWKGSRWGMTPAEVLAAFPGQAFRVEPEIRLEDGNTVTVGIDGLAFEGLTFRVRFLFEKGKLALVSLRTEPDKYVDAPAYEKLRKALVDRPSRPPRTTTSSTCARHAGTAARTGRI
jgi:hypothetical protein